MNPAEDNEPFVTPEEAANFLKISPVTVKKMAREGWLPAHPIGNGVRKRVDISMGQRNNVTPCSRFCLLCFGWLPGEAPISLFRFGRSSGVARSARVPADELLDD